MSKNMQISLSQREAIWLANFIMGSYSKDDAGEEGADFFQRLLVECMDLSKTRRSITSGNYLQTVEIKNYAGSIKVDLTDDVNALALFAQSPAMVEIIKHLYFMINDGATTISVYSLMDDDETTLKDLVLKVVESMGGAE